MRLKSCIENIERFIGTSKEYANFEKNLMLQQAVERNLEIIGEAVNNLLKIYPGIAITDARRMVDARNKIIHSNDDIQLYQV